MTEQDLHDLRRDVARLGQDLSRGLSATTVLIEQASKQLAELSRRVDDKVKEDHVSAIDIASKLSEIRTRLDSMQNQLGDIPDRLTKLETSHEHVAKDITGKHDLAKVAIETSEKKEDRALEERKLKADQRKATLQFWGGIAVVALPGLISLILHLLGIPSSSTSHEARPESPPTHESR
jgi:hypothetical protein